MESTEFGAAVRRWRDRVTTEAVGLPTGARRRATGLRREELAQLAGISVDYVTRLEQGRASSPSAQVVESIARALRLSAVERGHLYRLAGHAAPGPDTVSSHLTPSVQRLLDRLADTPVVVYDAAWNLVVANPAFSALMGDTSEWRGNERNGVWRNLVGPGYRVVHTTDERRAFEAGLVADLRMVAANYPLDRGLRRLITDLRAASPRFVELWDSGAVGHQQIAGPKTIAHPGVGAITLDCDILSVAGSDLHIMVYTAEPGTEDARLLALATVLGTQTLA